VGERDAVTVGGGTVDVVDAHRDLGHDPEARGGAGGEDLLVDPVPQRREESRDPGAHLLDDERFRGRLDLIVDLDRVAALAEAVEGLLPDVAGGVDPLRLAHGPFRSARGRLSSRRGEARITLPS